MIFMNIVKKDCSLPGKSITGYSMISSVQIDCLDLMKRYYGQLKLADLHLSKFSCAHS